MNEPFQECADWVSTDHHPPTPNENIMTTHRTNTGHVGYCPDCRQHGVSATDACPTPSRWNPEACAASLSRAGRRAATQAQKRAERELDRS